MDKKYIREYLRDKLAKISLSDRQRWEQKLVEEMYQWLKSHSGFWGFYNALPSEPQLKKLTQLCPQIRWCYPRVEGDNGLVFYEVISGSDWVEGSFAGLKEPNPQRCYCVNPNEMQGCIIPGLAFDRNGFRLGRGKGLYDRALAIFKGVKVGVLFSLQISELGLPHETHDVCMDYLFTENGLIAPLK
jgi:5-formyltetrahydrofolate cyclo-ligase